MESCRLCPASWLMACALVVPGCADKRDDGPAIATLTDGGIMPTGGDDDGIDDGIDDGGDDDEKLDATPGETEGAIPCAEGGDCDECVAYEHVPCDEGTNDPFTAMGLNCPGEATVMVTSQGSPNAIGVRSMFGTVGTWNAREGSVYAVLGSGLVADLDLATPPGDPDIDPTNCNDELPDAADPLGMLPAPIRTNDVMGDCTANPALLGTGDCSNTIQAQFTQGMAAFDYNEIRIVAEVPVTNNSLNYDFAFFSVEYPYYFGMVFNDMYIGWLESESWTGNISFDMMGRPISLNAGFLDYKDDGGNLPELAGTCMRQHAGTNWLQSSAPVTPGETITLVLAVFDLADPILDSYVFLDNFGWGCEGDSTPMTTPVG